jgi:hypothetical protein
MHNVPELEAAMKAMRAILPTMLVLTIAACAGPTEPTTTAPSDRPVLTAGEDESLIEGRRVGRIRGSRERLF